MHGGVGGVAGLSDVVAAVGGDGYGAGFDFGGCAGGVVTVPVPGNWVVLVVYVEMGSVWVLVGAVAGFGVK